MKLGLAPLSRTATSWLAALLVVACGGSSGGILSQPAGDPPVAAAPEAASAATTETAPDAAAPVIAATPRAPVFRTGAACPSVPVAANDPLVVPTDRGPLRGKKEGTTLAFLGVPFAAPPTGALRFAPPHDVDCSSSVREARDYGAKCMQRLASTTLAEGSEDCLFLNVWTPSADATKKRPVLFFVHGGAEVMGSANQTARAFGGNTYDGESLATNRDVVVVSVNYRLGPFGFLSLPGLDKERGTSGSGNWGLMDIVMALEWVSANIERFGGDPARVMLFGESAGALNTCTLVGSPLTKGLFSSALMQSGACDAAPADYRRQQGVTFAEAHDCTGDDATVLACLRSKSATSLAPVASQEVSFFDTEKTSDPKTSWYLGWGPVVDGYFLESSPLETIQQGKHQHVPLAIGTNANETEMFVPPVINTCIDYAADVQRRFGALASEIYTRYPCLAYPAARHATVDWTSDAQFTCHARRIARAVAANQTEPVYRYFYTHVPFSATAAMRAAHAAEVPFVFDTFFAAYGSIPTSSERELTASLQGYWTRFAAAGDPNGPGAASWPTYKQSDERVIVLDSSMTTLSKIKDEKCDFWDSLITP